ncbi:MAG: CvpA family protein [Bacteroidota bacterium]|jgi:membrane protein required for colicin V production
MNFFDAIICVPLLYGAYAGFKKGLIYEVAMILGLVVGIYLGFKCSDLIYGLLKKITDADAVVLHVVSFLVVVAAILLIFIFYARLMEAVLKITSLNVINKVAGAVLGIFKFAIAVSVVFWLLKPFEGKLDVIPEKSRNESLLYPYMLKSSSFITPVIQDVKDELNENLGGQESVDK